MEISPKPAADDDRQVDKQVHLAMAASSSPRILPATTNDLPSPPCLCTERPLLLSKCWGQETGVPTNSTWQRVVHSAASITPVDLDRVAGNQSVLVM
jgi:hypothetical protein